ncbi:MAG TPA: hypothetical protein VMC07_01740 [Candidatus Omnitrophota bacterium]|nr:hypothetical protein [Candidatus Omnitrophota bacterium]
MSEDRIRYVSKNKKECEGLEKAMTLFLEKYKITFDAIEIIVEGNGEDSVLISPKKGRIESIAATTDPAGLLRSSSPEYSFIQIDKILYNVRYKSTE